MTATGRRNGLDGLVLLQGVMSDATTKALLEIRDKRRSNVTVVGIEYEQFELRALAQHLLDHRREPALCVHDGDIVLEQKNRLVEIHRPLTFYFDRLAPFGPVALDVAVRRLKRAQDKARKRRRYRLSHRLRSR